ncbi:hypothetical protein KCU73_g140, partial [Aureobasidium melanogenum]
MRERERSNRTGHDGSLPVRLPLWWGRKGQCSLPTLSFSFHLAKATKPLQSPARKPCLFSLFAHATCLSPGTCMQEQ